MKKKEEEKKKKKRKKSRKTVVDLKKIKKIIKIFFLVTKNMIV